MIPDLSKPLAKYVVLGIETDWRIRYWTFVKPYSEETTESFADVKVNCTLSSNRLESIYTVLNKFYDVLTNQPSRTDPL